MLHVSKLNDINIKPIKIDNIDKTKIRGFKLFPELYSNIFICARKKMGKTTVIWNILRNCVGRDTKLVIFAATVHKDPTYKHIVKHFAEKGNEITLFTSIKDGKTDNLNEFVESLRQPEELSESKEEDQMPFIIVDDEQTKEKKPRKEKLMSPEIVFIFDDLSKELQSNAISMLLKSNRHYKSKVILSSQYIHDLKPESILQLDYLLLFGNITKDKIEIIHNRTDLSISLMNFEGLYEFATREQYSFLYVDTVNNSYRMKFNKNLVIK